MSSSQCSTVVLTLLLNAFNRKCRFSGYASSETLWPIFKKMAQLITSGTPPYTQVLGSIGSKGACLRMRETVTLRRLFFSFLRFHAPRYTGRLVGPIVVVNGSNDASSWPSRLFYSFVNKKNIFPIFYTKMWKIALHPMGNLNSYNFGILEDTYKLFAPSRGFTGSRNRMVSFKFTHRNQS